MQHGQPIIVAEGLTVVRGKTTALEDVSFVMEAGKITGLIGPSGSGKTTLIRAVAGIQLITGGKLDIFGLPAGSKQTRKRTGYMPQTPAVYIDLTVRQNLNYFGAIFGASGKDVDAVLQQVDLKPQAKQMVGSLSGGQLARVSLAVALLSRADLLVLDEPTVGLDPVLREKLWDLFRQLAASGHSLLISSHVMDEAEKCEDIMLLREGKVLEYGPKDALLKRAKKPTVEAAFLSLARGSEHAS